jgi:hypothetical protein
MRRRRSAEDRALAKSARAVSAGHKTLKEHEAFVEAVLGGEVPIGRAWHATAIAVVATLVVLVAFMALGFVLATVTGRDPDTAAPRVGHTAAPAAPAGHPGAPATVIAATSLPRAIAKAREEWVDRTATTRYEKALRNRVMYGFCDPRARLTFRCTVVEQLPPSTSTTEVRFDVRLDADGCWSAVIADGADPSGSGDLRGCL